MESSSSFPSSPAPLSPSFSAATTATLEQEHNPAETLTCEQEQKTIEDLTYEQENNHTGNQTYEQEQNTTDNLTREPERKFPWTCTWYEEEKPEPGSTSSKQPQLKKVTRTFGRFGVVYRGPMRPPLRLDAPETEVEEKPKIEKRKKVGTMTKFFYTQKESLEDLYEVLGKFTPEMAAKGIPDNLEKMYQIWRQTFPKPKKSKSKNKNHHWAARWREEIQNIIAITDKHAEHWKKKESGEYTEKDDCKCGKYPNCTVMCRRMLDKIAEKDKIQLQEIKRLQADMAETAEQFEAMIGSASRILTDLGLKSVTNEEEKQAKPSSSSSQTHQPEPAKQPQPQPQPAASSSSSSVLREILDSIGTDLPAPLPPRVVLAQEQALYGSPRRPRTTLPRQPLFAASLPAAPPAEVEAWRVMREMRQARRHPSFWKRYREPPRTVDSGEKAENDVDDDSQAQAEDEDEGEAGAEAEANSNAENKDADETKIKSEADAGQS